MTSYDILTMLLQKCTHYNDSRSLVCIGLDFSSRHIVSRFADVCCFCESGWLTCSITNFPGRLTWYLLQQSDWQQHLETQHRNELSKQTIDVANQAIFMDQSHPQLQPHPVMMDSKGWFTSYINLNLIRCTKTWFQQTPGDAENLKYYALFRNTYIAWQEEDHQKATVVFRLVRCFGYNLAVWFIGPLPRGLDSPSTFYFFFNEHYHPKLCHLHYFARIHFFTCHLLYMTPLLLRWTMEHEVFAAADRFNHRVKMSEAVKGWAKE